MSSAVAAVLFAAAAILATAVPVSAHAGAERHDRINEAAVGIGSYWQQQHCQPAATDVMHFQLYLKWNNEALLDAFVHSGATEQLPFDPHSSVDDTEAVLGRWRSLLKPDASHFAQTMELLKNSGVAVASACTIQWDSVHCRGVPVHVVASLFAVEICAYAQDVPRVVAAVPELRGRIEGSTFWLTSKQKHELLTPALGAFVRYIGGVTMFDPTIVPRRTEISRDNQHRDPSPAPAAAAPYINHFDWPINTGSNAPVILSGLGLPQFAPVSAMGAMSVAVACKSGKPTYTNATGATTAPAHWCPGSSVFPSKMNVSVVGSFNVVSVELAASNCAPALSGNPAINATSEWASMVVCNFEAHPLVVGLKTWERYEVTAFTVFSDGSSSEVAHMKNFWQADFPGTMMKVTVPNPLTPSDIRSLYHIPESELLTSPRSAQGILEFSDTLDPRQGFQLSDLKLFLVQYGVVNATAADAYLEETLSRIGTDALESRGETSLDVEMMMSLARGGKTYLWNIINGPNEQYVHWAQAFIAWAQNVTSGTAPSSALPPSVWSVSYGGPEWNTTSDSLAEMDVLNGYFKLMTASGVTMVISSGDSGAGFQTTAPMVSYPASSPYVVAVGATALRRTVDSDGADVVQQAACSAADGNVITTGGAFSQFFTLPAFQASAVTAYIDAQGPDAPPAQFPPNQRAVPDAAAIGAWVNIVISNGTIPVFGTSISAPVFSSMLSLANDRRRAAGLAPVTLANWMVYNATRSGAAVFSDVVVGSNCAGEQYGYPANFPTYSRDSCYNATVGWDAASGVGAPLYPAFASFALRWGATDGL